jgi:hypothetical protein
MFRGLKDGLLQDGGQMQPRTHYGHGVTGEGFPHDLQAETESKCISAPSIERGPILFAVATKRSKPLF